MKRLITIEALLSYLPHTFSSFIYLYLLVFFLLQVYIPNSSKNCDVGHPFGYLKASTTLQSVNLFVMPYNYPVLLPLLDDLFKTHRLKPTKEWRMQFENYLRTMPPYYANVSIGVYCLMLWIIVEHFFCIVQPQL